MEAGIGSSLMFGCGQAVPIAIDPGAFRVCGYFACAWLIWFALASVSDVPGRSDISIGDAPGLSILVQIDDPHDVVVAMARFDEVGNAFASRAGPAWAANNHTNERWV